MIAKEQDKAQLIRKFDRQSLRLIAAPLATLHQTTSTYYAFIPFCGKDVQVRPKNKHLLVAAYRPFPFQKLPVELSLRILNYATACSQATYRSLSLTNRAISDLIRSEKMLAGVSITLVNERQLLAFESFLKLRPEVIPYIHNLWTICPGSVRRVARSCISIINTCTHIRSLACHPHVLLESICRGAVFKHTHCVDLTMIQFRVTWSTFMDASTNGTKFFHQLRRLHFIGALDHSMWATWAIIPKLNNVTRVSIAMGSHREITPSLFNQLITSPKLEQVVITTRLHGEDQQILSDVVQDIDERFSLIHRRRRWKESNLWHESLQDPNRFWDQAKAEKDLPPAPRPTATQRA
ncbi:hypothetical protein B0H12DRAFT_1102476 [Mycena haematopus]|nr:hypothetical protein B0H12DRAFT_1102476 [Mycena haematopus]